VGSNPTLTANKFSLPDPALWSGENPINSKNLQRYGELILTSRFLYMGEFLHALRTPISEAELALVRYI
jgi:hypothetical protein